MAEKYLMYSQLCHRCTTRTLYPSSEHRLVHVWSCCKINAAFTVMAWNDLEKKRCALFSAEARFDWPHASDLWQPVALVRSLDSRITTFVHGTSMKNLWTDRQQCFWLNIVSNYRKLLHRLVMFSCYKQESNVRNALTFENMKRGKSYFMIDISRALSFRINQSKRSFWTDRQHCLRFDIISNYRKLDW